MSIAGIVGAALVSAGIALMAITALGLARLPDFFARVHAASKSETLGVSLALAGLIVYEGATLASAKLALVVVFIAITSPVAAHALTRAAVRTGVLPWRRTEESPARSSAGEESPARVHPLHSAEGREAPNGAGEGA